MSFVENHVGCYLEFAGFLVDVDYIFVGSRVSQEDSSGCMWVKFGGTVSWKSYNNSATKDS